MAQWRDFLGRFRPAAAPGAASPRGVPADRAAAAATELEPLFALLDDIDAEAERIRRDAAAQAARLRADSRAAAERIVARATDDAAAAAEAAQARVRAGAGTAEQELDARHRAGVAALRTKVAARLPDYLDHVVRQATSMMTSGPRG
jgi:hypothetical protein